MRGLFGFGGTAALETPRRQDACNYTEAEPYQSPGGGATGERLRRYAILAIACSRTPQKRGPEGSDIAPLPPRPTIVRAATTTAEPFIPAAKSLKVLSSAVNECKGCDLYLHATQAVFGAGPSTAVVMLIGEQPGDQEDRQGAPFVGPAGKLLDKALEEAGIDRDLVYVTNAVKHFKFEERGKRRIHKKPSTIEIRACNPWLEAEIRVVHPKVVVPMGATALLAVLGKDAKLTRDRGKFFPHDGVEAVLPTIHPSALLRMPEPERRHAEFAAFVNDLRLVQRRIGV